MGVFKQGKKGVDAATCHKNTKKCILGKIVGSKINAVNFLSEEAPLVFCTRVKSLNNSCTKGLFTYYVTLKLAIFDPPCVTDLVKILINLNRNQT